MRSIKLVVVASLIFSFSAFGANKFKFYSHVSVEHSFYGHCEGNIIDRSSDGTTYVIDVKCTSEGHEHSARLYDVPENQIQFTKDQKTKRSCAFN